VADQDAAERSLTVREIGEFGLIARLQRRIDARQAVWRGSAPMAELAIGDDAAVWQPTPGARQVITTDALIEDVHFRPRTSSWRDLGWKAMAVNVSDVAAMGAQPRSALVTLGLPSSARLADLLELYDGMLDLGERYQVELIGGDVVSSSAFVLNVTVIGEATGPLLRRDGAQAGDLLAVTGTLGASAGGFRLLEKGAKHTQSRQRLMQAHLRPVPRVAEGAALAAAGLRCGMDVSDGLLGDAAHICERSGLGAKIVLSKVPIAAELVREFGDQALALAVGGGEDYELLCAGPPDAIERARVALAALGTGLTVVGNLTERPSNGALVRLVDQRGLEVELGALSWDHFRA
jgi:thiamine-monophosphate kinase